MKIKSWSSTVTNYSPGLERQQIVCILWNSFQPVWNCEFVCSDYRNPVWSANDNRANFFLAMIAWGKTHTVSGGGGTVFPTCMRFQDWVVNCTHFFSIKLHADTNWIMILNWAHMLQLTLSVERYDQIATDIKISDGSIKNFITALFFRFNSKLSPIFRENTWNQKNCNC